MSPSRNPAAAIYVGQLICSHLNKAPLSREEFAQRLEISVSKLDNLLVGRHYFPLELVKVAAEALGIEEGELAYFVLRQYFPNEAIDSTFEGIGAYAIRRHDQTGKAPKGTSKKKKKKKRDA